MIFTTEEINAISEKLNLDGAMLNMTLSGIEDFIRGYTNNSFTVRGITIYTPSTNGKLDKVSPIFKVGDTIQIKDPACNAGIYVIQDLDGTLDKELFDANSNKISLVKYPPAIKFGVMKLLQYSVKMDNKMGISSESLSRHSVSYAQPTGDSIGGYPAYLMTFLKPFMKARF